MGLSDILRAEFEEAIRGNPESVRETLDEMHPADIADLLKQLDHEVQAKVIPLVPDAKAAEVIDYLGSGNRAPVFRLLAPELQVRVAENMSADDRADMFAALDEETREAVLARLPKIEATDVATLMHYPPNTAGGLMTTDVVPIAVDLTVGEVLERIRAIAEETETVTYVYLTDRSTSRLMGVLSLRELVLSRPNRPVAEVMNDKVITVGPLTDQEEVARTIAKYDLVALPVVDDNHTLLGIVTVDDIVDVVQQAATEDIQKFGGMEALDAPYLTIAFGRMVKKRAGWLAALFLGEMLTATAMARFEDLIARAVVLALFVPLIISSGGNSGSQASTLVIRALALGEVTLRDWWRVIRRELGAGLALGAVLGSIGFLRIVVWQALTPLYGPHYLLVALTVFFSLVGVVCFGTLMGSLLPLILRRLGFDPASAAAPFVATLVDVTGLVIYFSIAAVILRGTLL